MNKTYKSINKLIKEGYIVKNFTTIDNGRTVLNLENVTNVVFEDNSNKIIFNFNNNIEIKTKKGIQVIADYRYDNHLSKESYLNSKIDIETKMINMKFIKPIDGLSSHHWVNPKHITFVNIDYKKLRLIFNLDNSVTKPIDGEIMLVNDFVFWDHNSIEELEDSVEYVFSKLTK